VEYFSRYPNDRVQSVFNPGQLVSPPYGAFNMYLMDASLGWIAAASDLVRLFEFIADGTMGRKDNTLIGEGNMFSMSERTMLLSNDTVKEMLARPRYTNASVW